MVCVGTGPDSNELIRAAQELASIFRVEWIAAHVEPQAPFRPSPTDQKSMAETLRLAEQLGAETVRLGGLNAPDEVLRYARDRGVTRVMLGKPLRSRLSARFRPSFIEELVRKSNDIDVYVVSSGRTRTVTHLPQSTRAWDWRGFAFAFGTVAFSTLISATLFGRANLPNVIIIYVLSVVFVALRYGYGPALLAAVLTVLVLDFAFIRPYRSFAVADPRDAITVAVMFVASLIIASLAKRVRDQASLARQREVITALLYAMSRELAGTLGIETMLRVAIRHLHDAFNAPIAVLLPDSSGALKSAVTGPRSFELGSSDRQVAEWVWQHERSAGWGTDTFPKTDAQFLLLRGSRGKVGTLGIKHGRDRPVDPGQLQLLRTFAAQVGSALERGQLAEAAQRAEVQIETERLRSSLLSSVSHDLRTPLGVITGATSTLLQDEQYLDPAARRDLLESAHEEAERLNRLVGNLLDMTRLASGTLKPKKEWHPLDEIIGVALNRLEVRLQGRDVRVVLPADLPPLPIDAVLVEQVLINLIENAIKYTPTGSPLELSASAETGAVEVALADRGPGIPRGERSQVFDKFYRMKPDVSDGGAGLGLAICRGIVEAHGGRIWVDDREGGGAVFRFFIPLEGGPPPFVGDAWQPA
jgi:two-component system sensor histidine kinase KdpD